MGNSTTPDTASESAALELSSLYGYTPTTSICVLFVVLYSLTALVHVAQATRLRVWWMIPTVVLCGLSEIIGWAARLWNSNNSQEVDPFLIRCAIYWSQMRTGSPTPIQDHDHYYSTFVPHCGRFQYPNSHNKAHRDTV